MLQFAIASNFPLLLIIVINAFLMGVKKAHVIGLMGLGYRLIIIFDKNIGALRKMMRNS
jgi:hypothetical protein